MLPLAGIDSGPDFGVGGYQRRLDRGEEEVGENAAASQRLGPLDQGCLDHVVTAEHQLTDVRQSEPRERRKFGHQTGRCHLPGVKCRRSHHCGRGERSARAHEPDSNLHAVISGFPRVPSLCARLNGRYGLSCAETRHPRHFLWPQTTDCATTPMPGVRSTPSALLVPTHWWVLMLFGRGALGRGSPRAQALLGPGHRNPSGSEARRNVFAFMVGERWPFGGFDSSERHEPSVNDG